VLERGTARLKVQLPSGRAGWVNKSNVTATQLWNVTGTRFTERKVAVHNGPRASAGVIGTARLGTKVTRLALTRGLQTNMVKLRLPSGRTGWVRAGASNITRRDVWGALARCESGGNPRTNTGNGYYGLYQFSARTWRSVGGRGLPHQNSAAEQTKRAQILQERAGWGQWPACSRRLGLR
jgi:hypothetical protein